MFTQGYENCIAVIDYDIVWVGCTLMLKLQHLIGLCRYTTVRMEQDKL